MDVGKPRFGVMKAFPGFVSQAFERGLADVTVPAPAKSHRSSYGANRSIFQADPRRV